MNLQTLIVDDDDLVTLLHKIILQGSGYSNIHEFSNGKDVLNHLLNVNDKNTDILIFLDINMPIMNGWEFLDAIQELRFPFSLNIVIVTSSINPADRDKANEYPSVINYVEKPLTENLATELRSQLMQIIRLNK